MSQYKTPSDIHPCLTYADANAAIDWLCRAFGFTKRLVARGPDGTVQHSELSLGTGVVMVSSPRPGRQPPGTVTQPMRDEEYGARGYGVADLEGHNWYFGNYRPGAYWEGSAGDAQDA
jgi:uncharacterized glyoxalase superfamily protein PhnB